MDERTERMVRQHLEGLKSAGVEWLPKSKAVPVPSLQTESMPRNRGERKTIEAPASDTSHMPSIEERGRRLELLRETVKGCTRCTELAETRTQTVFGVGPLGAELCFVGEAPGADEDRQGEPFVGAAGQLLNKIIVACGMRREDVYICNILRCRPPGNRQPAPDEASNCREYLEKTLALVQPKYIVALGAIAAQNLMQTTEAIGKMRGRFLDYRGIRVLCTYHPAFLLRNPTKKRDVWEDMKFLLRDMGRPIPGQDT